MKTGFHTFKFLLLSSSTLLSVIPDPDRGSSVFLLSDRKNKRHWIPINYLDPRSSRGQVSGMTNWGIQGLCFSFILLLSFLFFPSVILLFLSFLRKRESSVFSFIFLLSSSLFPLSSSTLVIEDPASLPSPSFSFCHSCESGNPASLVLSFPHTNDRWVRVVPFSSLLECIQRPQVIESAVEAEWRILRILRA